MINLSLFSTAVLIWGTTWLAIKFQLTQVDPTLSVAYRFFLASAILVIFCLITRKSLRFNLKQHAFLALYGATLFGLGYILCYWATSYLTSGLVSITFSLIQIMNIINLRLFLGKPMQKQAILGALFGFIGLMFVFHSELLDFSLTTGLKGFLIAIIATCCASMGNVVGVRNMASGIPVTQGNTMGMLYGAIFTLILYLAMGGQFTMDWTWGYLGPMLYLALFGSVISFGCYMTLIKRIGADYAAYAGTFNPILAMTLSTLYEGYVWTVPATIGFVSVLIGMVIILTPRHRLLKLVDKG